MSEPRFSPGDRVVHIRGDSQIPEGAKGTVLGEAPPYYQAAGYAWEVEYDGIPCEAGHPEIHRSPTSWFSRDDSIELTREEALKRARGG